MHSASLFVLAEKSSFTLFSLINCRLNDVQLIQFCARGRHHSSAHMKPISVWWNFLFAIWMPREDEQARGKIAIRPSHCHTYTCCECSQFSRGHDWDVKYKYRTYNSTKMDINNNSTHHTRVFHCLYGIWNSIHQWNCRFKPIPFWKMKRREMKRQRSRIKLSIAQENTVIFFVTSHFRFFLSRCGCCRCYCWDLLFSSNLVN